MYMKGGHENGCGTHLLCGSPLRTNIDSQCASLYLVRLAVLRTVGWLNFGRGPVMQVSSADCFHTAPDVCFPLVCISHSTQDSRLSRTTVVNQLYKCRVPVVFTRQVSIAVQCIGKSQWMWRHSRSYTHMFLFTCKWDDVVWTYTGCTSAMSSPTLNEACGQHVVSLCSFIVIVNKQSSLCSKQMVCNACTMWYTWNKWCAMYLLCDILETNGVQCLHYVIYLKQMVCNVFTMWYTWNKWCAMLVLCDIFEMNGVQCLYYVLYSKQMVSNACMFDYVK